MKPFIVGTLILVIGAGLGTTTGFAINPARDWGHDLRIPFCQFPIRKALNGDTHGCRCLAR